MDNPTTRARELLTRCGVDHEGLGDGEAVTRADAVAAAAGEYTAGNAAVLDEHLKDEFELHDADATMETMGPEPYLDHVPVNTGGIGRDEVERVRSAPTRSSTSSSSPSPTPGRCLRFSRASRPPAGASSFRRWS